MMNNLFSIFDSSTNMMFDMNWISSWMNLFYLPMFFWLSPSRLTLMYKFIIFNLFNELKMILFNKFNMFNILLFISMLILIFLNNFMGLFPYIFTSSSHLIFSISFSLPMWISFMMFGWKNNKNFMFSHMIPQSTPYMLMPFMVLIETISNLIRPGTLTIRLTANMIAGHLLLTLLSQSAESLTFFLSFMIITIQIILLILEFSVSIIQSYVFTILSTLYSKETNYEKIMFYLYS